MSLQQIIQPTKNLYYGVLAFYASSQETQVRFFFKQVTKYLYKNAVLLTVAEILLIIHNPKRSFYSKILHKFIVGYIMKTISPP